MCYHLFSLSSNSACRSSNFCCSTTNSIRSLQVQTLSCSNPFSACCHGGFHRWSTFNLNSRHISKCLSKRRSFQTSFQMSLMRPTNWHSRLIATAFNFPTQGTNSTRGTVAKMRLPKYLSRPIPTARGQNATASFQQMSCQSNWCGRQNASNN